MSQYSSRMPLESVSNQARESYFSSNQKVTTTVRQCVSTTQNMAGSYMKRSMSNTNIYSSQINTPPQQRQQLGKNMDVVCFLLACEVERFLCENDKLKYRIKEMDDKLLDRNSYEKQIEDLQARLYALQYQESMFRQEIEISTTTLTQEVESWRTRFFSMEDKYKQENESLKTQLLQGDQRKSKEIDDLKAQCFNLRSQYESELQKTRESLQQKQSSIDYLQNENKELQYQLKAYKLQDEKMRDYENKIGMLVCETERLNGLLKQKLEELESQRKVNSQQNYEIEKLRQDYRTLQLAFEKKQKEFDQLNQQFILIQNELVRYRDQDQIIEQLQNKIALLTSEIERLNQVLREKINQGEEWRAKFFTSENQCNEMKQRLQKLDQLQYQLKEQLDKLNMMANSLEDMKQKNFNLQQNNQLLENQNMEYQNRIVIVSQEVERLNTILKTKIQELEEWKQKNNYLEGELKNKSASLNDCKQKLGSLSQEIDRLQDILKHKQNELGESNNANKQYQKELQNSEQLQQQLIKTIEEWKRKFEYEQNETSSRNKKLIEYENRIALMSQEIERLNQVLQGKLQELDEMKRMQSNLKGQLQQRTGELEELNGKYGSLKIQLGNYYQLEEKLKQYQMRVILHCSEIDRLTMIQGEVFEENEQLQKQIQHYQNQIKQKDDQIYKALDRNNLLQKLCDEEKQKRLSLEIQIKEGYETKLSNYEMKVVMLTSELQRVNEQLRIRNGEVEDYRTSIQRYENKLIILNQEIERLNVQLRKISSEYENTQREHDGLSQQYQLLLRQLEEWKQKYSSIEIYRTKYQDLENRCAMLSTEIERLQKLLNQRNEEIEQYKRKCFSLEQTIVELRQYEENVRILSQEIDRLQGIIDQQEAELRTWRLQYADGGAVNRKLQDLMFHFVVMSAEIECLRARVQEKEKEVEEVRRSSLAPYRR